MAGRQTQAIKLAEDYLEQSLDTISQSGKKKSINQANIICLIGDMKRDESLYEKAWEVSGEKCARAMRSLGRVLFHKGEFQKSVDCFMKGLAINRLYKDAWFTCGCAHMRLEQFEKAIFAFGNVVSIDE